ncbi:hypothetical protein GA0074695_4802 [Micromonospora viridifaciens]|uniref:Uncharacterized protein n=1 Tax=Micromonospora viridifaciens TaxID=1881 RepID=A0A1C4YXP5_MICVI|nr:hypothetical protein GA0074695_4802 [Micromonospora viridifaciens]
MYLVRHFLTQARLSGIRALAGFDNGVLSIGPDQLRDFVDDMCVNVKAADITLLAAESLLPKDGRQVEGQTFWNRFANVSNQRKNEAQKDLVDLRAASRSTR